MPTMVQINSRIQVPFESVSVRIGPSGKVHVASGAAAMGPRGPIWGRPCRAPRASGPAATPAPRPTPYRIDLTKVQPKSLLPKVALHTEYIVAVNKLGQVTRIISGKTSKDRTYNIQTAGNALQAFIRTPEGKAIPGSYRLTYDYSPKTTRIHRDVAALVLSRTRKKKTGEAPPQPSFP